MPVYISVIICSYNREKYIADALNSLIQQDYDPSLFEVIVVDNNSKDNTETVCKNIIASYRQHLLYYYSEKQQGSSFARNTGAAHAKGRLLCFMDDDAIAEKDFIKNIWDFHLTHPAVGGFGGRIIPRYIPSEPKWMSHWVASLVGNFDYADNITEFSPNRYPLESNMIVVKEAFDEVGGFSMAIPGVKGALRIGGEGKDFFMRLKAKGYSICYVPNIIVHHVVETEKLTKEYMYRVASGIGRGERLRIEKGIMPFLKKLFEYLYKLGGSVIIAASYFLKGKSAKAWPVIQFRVDVLKGFLGR
jgi:glycosyltransferase involved in cell wall biosynthesis